MTDRHIVELARRGEAAAAGELFSRYWRAARAAAFAVTGEWASAEDAASEGFRQALESLASLRDSERFAAWLRAIVVRKARETRLPMDAPAADPADPAEPLDRTLERARMSAVLHRAVRALPEPLREAIALHYFEGYEQDAAARFLGVPPGTLRRRLHEGRRRLRDAVQSILERCETMEDTTAVERIRRLMEEGGFHAATREALTLGPATPELARLFRGAAPVDLAEHLMRELPPVPVDSGVAAAIRAALKDRPDIEILESVALVRVGEAGLRSVAELLRAHADPEQFRDEIARCERVPAIDLRWTGPAPIELSEVQDALEALAAAVCPGLPCAAKSYGEPRYRAALELTIAGERAALGGVLAARDGDRDTVHARLFASAWRAA